MIWQSRYCLQHHLGSICFQKQIDTGICNIVLKSSNWTYAYVMLMLINININLKS